VLPPQLQKLPASLRPDRSLLSYYLLSALLAGPLFPVVALYLYFRFQTLRYEIDEEGLTMRWGILFRREILLTYSRIQDIHLTSNVIERYFGLAKVQLQTAAGSAQAEMSIEGLGFFEELRDFLYSKMRGAREERAAPAAARPADPLAAVLREVAAEVKALREQLAGRGDV
jgi:uncharacterized membrane protein YdbT with pleckstrin-like domain